MPQYAIYITPEIEKEILKLKQEWKLSKTDIIQKILDDYFKKIGSSQ
jgi:hypothetical protein